MESKSEATYSDSNPESLIDQQLEAMCLDQSLDFPDPLKSDDGYMQDLARMKQRGRIELIMGPMFAGKSTELLRRVRRLQISGKKCLSIKYSMDERYSKAGIATHDQVTHTAVACRDLCEVKDHQWR